MSVARSRTESETNRRRRSQDPMFDVVILGGGVLGLSTGCEILTRGLSVAIYDEDPLRSATWASAGMLSPYAEHAERGAMQDMLRAARVAYPAYVERLERASGSRVELAFPGTILPGAGENQRDHLEQLAVRMRDLGASCRYLESSELFALEPQVGLKQSGAVLLEDEGYVNPQTLHLALQAAFDRLGGTWVRLAAIGLLVRQGRIAGVEVPTGPVLAGAVVNACGSWAERFLLPEDVERYRTRPIRGQTVRLRPPTRREGICHVIQLLGVGYLVPRTDGTVIVGATSEDVGPFAQTTAGGIRSLLETARMLIPSSTGWEMVSASAGLRPMAGDGEFVLEPDSARKGLFHGLGLYRHGILLAPVAATRMTRMVVEYLGHAGQ